MTENLELLLFRTDGRLYKPLEKLTSVSRAKPVSFAVCMKEGEKGRLCYKRYREGFVKLLTSGMILSVMAGRCAVASEGGEICKANFASWVILKVLRISGTLDYWQTTDGTAGAHMVRTPAGYGYTTVGRIPGGFWDSEKLSARKC